VVHYDLPKDSESFLHRSGRTGRAGKSGTTIAMFRPNESGYFRRIVRDVGAKNVEFIGPPGPQLVMNASAKQARPWRPRSSLLTSPTHLGEAQKRLCDKQSQELAGTRCCAVRRAISVTGLGKGFFHTAGSDVVPCRGEVLRGLLCHCPQAGSRRDEQSAEQSAHASAPGQTLRRLDSVDEKGKALLIFRVAQYEQALMRDCVGAGAAQAGQRGREGQGVLRAGGDGRAGQQRRAQCAGRRAGRAVGHHRGAQAAQARGPHGGPAGLRGAGGLRCAQLAATG
jgi:superfamily II DNA/RNA helicase